MWIAKKDNKIIVADIDEQRFQETISGMTDIEISETDEDIVLLDNEIFIKDSPEYIAKQQEIEHNRIQELYMTRSDFFDGTIRAFQATEQILEIVIAQALTSLPISDIDKLVAMNNFENALNFYRKHTLFTLLSGIDLHISETLTVRITSEQWDRFFDETTKRNPDAYKELLPPQS